MEKNMKRLTLAAIVLGMMMAVMGAATQPATKPATVKPLIAELAKMPSNLRPTSGETEVVHGLREKWIGTLLNQDKTIWWEVKGSLVTVSPANGHVAVDIEMTNIHLWGGIMSARCRIVLENVTPEGAAGWKVGRLMTFVVRSGYAETLGSTMMTMNFDYGNVKSPN
jgi:hypothetical protein